MSKNRESRKTIEFAVPATIYNLSNHADQGIKILWQFSIGELSKAEAMKAIDSWRSKLASVNTVICPTESSARGREVWQQCLGIDAVFERYYEKLCLGVGNQPEPFDFD